MSTIVSPKVPRPACPSRLTWFTIGLITGFVFAILGFAFFLLVLAVQPQSTMPNIAATTGAQPAVPIPTDHALVARYAQLIAAPLTTPLSGPANPGMERQLANLAAAITQADALALENNELAPIAAEFASSLRALDQLINSESINLMPLLRASTDTLQAVQKDDFRELLPPLLEVFGETSRIQESIGRFRAVHLRLVSCRLRLADAVQRLAPVASTDPSANIAVWQFDDSGVNPFAPNDALFLTNVSGIPLTQVFVITELTGETGETFENCYYADRWETDQTLQALCRSAATSRETVRHVKKVRFRLIAAERTSGIAEMNR